MAGQVVGTIELNDKVFGIEPNAVVMHADVKNHLANMRHGTQSTLTRAEVSGGGRKPWRQKGTGHARQGSTRAPQWKGGGVVFAPTPRDYSFKMNKKEKQAAVRSALTDRVQQNKVIVLDQLAMSEYKTKEFVKVMENLKAAGKTLVVMADKDEKVVKSASNIPAVKTTLTSQINVYDLMNAQTVILTKDAVAKLEEVYA
jgi:large subunit ribosomal protein L4